MEEKTFVIDDFGHSIKVKKIEDDRYSFIFYEDDRKLSFEEEEFCNGEYLEFMYGITF